MITTITLTDLELAKIHKALCLLAERERDEAAADPQIDALFPDAAADRAATDVLCSTVYHAYQDAFAASRPWLSKAIG